MFNSKFRSLKLALFGGFLASTISVSGCCAEKPTHVHSKDMQPFSIGFSKDGTPILLGEDGKPLEQTKETLPIKATAVERIDTITMVQIRGSHFTWIQMGGRKFKVNLSH